MHLKSSPPKCRRTTVQMRIYEAMVAIDGARSYVHVRADNMSQAFDRAIIRVEARYPRSYVEVLTAQELREPVSVYIRPVNVSRTPIDDMDGISYDL
jgi:hypothetical protein